MIIPPPLSPGDKIGIISIAGIVDRQALEQGISLVRSWNFVTVPGKTIGKEYRVFAGDDAFRQNELQQFLDDPTIRAIIFARGGYGAVRIIDRIDFKKFASHPKWLAGFSDLTVLLNHVVENYKIAAIHGPMVKSLSPGKPAEYLQSILSGEPLSSFTINTSSSSIPGLAEGIICGGNLSLLQSISGSKSDFNPAGKILFLEDTSEYLYHTDRMLWQLKRSKDLSKLKGVIAGKFSAMKDNRNRPFGENPYEMIAWHFSEFSIPVLSGFPAGHVKNNYPLVFGRKIRLEVTKSKAEIKYL